MKRTISLSVLTISLLTMLLSAQSVGAAGWLHFEVTCPNEEGQVLFPADQRLKLTDIILSASGETTFSLVFVPPLPGEAAPEFPLMKVFFRRIGGTVVSNFVGNVEGEDEFSLVAKCTAPEGSTQTVSVTLVGSEVF